MPFIVKFPGGFLNRDGSHKRRLTDDQDEATVWSKAGHAKNAARAAVENGIKIGKTEKVQIIPVTLKIACVITFHPLGPIAYDCESYDPRK